MTNNTIFPPVIGNASLSCFQDLEWTNFFFSFFSLSNLVELFPVPKPHVLFCLFVFFPSYRLSPILPCESRTFFNVKTKMTITLFVHYANTPSLPLLWLYRKVRICITKFCSSLCFLTCFISASLEDDSLRWKPFSASEPPSGLEQW